MQGLYDTVNGTAVVPAVPALPPALAAGALANMTAAECAADPRCYYAVTWNQTLQYMFIYHFFGLLWGHSFIVGFGCALLPRACMFPPRSSHMSSELGTHAKPASQLTWRQFGRLVMLDQ